MLRRIENSARERDKVMAALFGDNFKFRAKMREALVIKYKLGQL